MVSYSGNFATPAPTQLPADQPWYVWAELKKLPKGKRYPDAEKVLVDSNYAVDYAKEFVQGRWLEAEENIKKSKKSVEYAIDVIKGRWPEAEEYILKDISLIINYAKYVIKGRWRNGEYNLLSNPLANIHFICDYKNEVAISTWPEAEQAILKSDARVAWNYTSRCIKNRWPEAEPLILKSVVYTLLYVQNIIKERWPEGEKTIKKVPKVLFYTPEIS